MFFIASLRNYSSFFLITFNTYKEYFQSTLFIDDILSCHLAI